MYLSGVLKTYKVTELVCLKCFPIINSYDTRRILIVSSIEGAL